MDLKEPSSKCIIQHGSFNSYSLTFSHFVRFIIFNLFFFINLQQKRAKYTAILTRLVNELNTRRVLFEKVGSGQIAFQYDKWRVIEEEVAKELASRATDNGSINTHSLKSV